MRCWSGYVMRKGNLELCYKEPAVVWITRAREVEEVQKLAEDSRIQQLPVADSRQA